MSFSAGLSVLAVLAIAGCAQSVRKPAPDVSPLDRNVQVGSAGGDSMALRPLGLGGYRPKGGEPYYRVSKTDTFGTIAKKFYGDDKYYDELFFANQETVSKAGGLKRGVLIILPTMEDGTKPELPTQRP